MADTLRYNTRDREVCDLVRRVVNEGIPPEAHDIYVSRNRICSVTLPSGRKVNIKEFHAPSFPNSHIYGTLRGSKAKRSYTHALRLKEAGIQTPEPLAYAERRKGGRLGLSYYFSEQIDGLHDAREWDELPDRDAFAAALAVEIARFWRAGIRHRDFTPGNILWTRDNDGQYRFTYVDLNRMSFGVRSHKSLMQLFRALNIDPAETARAAGFFADTIGFDRADTIAEALETQRRFVDRKNRLRRLKRLIKGR